MNVKKVGVLAALPLTVLLSTKAFAFGMMEVQDWDFQFSGNVNSFLTSTSCKNDSNGNGTDVKITGGLACGSGGNSDDATNVRTGLLPSWFGFRAERQIEDEGDFKTGVTLGIQPGGDDGKGGGALGNNTTNLRQVFFDVSSADFGTFKMGRDLGLFGGDAILSDMTLLGVGTVSDITKRGGNTSLGRIGVGYLYADWKAQVQYTTPDLGGLTFSIALVDPWQDNSGRVQQADNFGLEGKVNYTVGNLKLWAGFINQKVDLDAVAAVAAKDAVADVVINIPGGGNITIPGSVAVPAVPAVPAVDYDATGYDIGVKWTAAGLELVGYYYSGEGIGTTGFLLNGSDNGEERDSDGYYVQATYKVGDTKYGISFGESSLDLADGEAVSNLVETNESVILGVYHSLNSALTLVAEYTKTESTAHNGNEAEEGSFAIGGIMFF